MGAGTGDDTYDPARRSFDGVRLLDAITQSGHTVPTFAALIGRSPATLYRALSERPVQSTTRLAILDGLHRANARRLATPATASFGQRIPAIMVDAHGRILASTPALRTLLGYTHEELTGLNCFDITHPDDVPALAAQLHQVASGERSHAYLTKRCVTRAGDVAMWRTTALSLRPEEPTDTVVILLDPVVSPGSASGASQ
jgi:PAS domain S-box-containing protein